MSRFDKLLRRLRGVPLGSPFYGRGLRSFEAATPPGWPTLSERVEALLPGRERVRILEIGSGEGRLLLDLLARFGARVALHGVNHPRFGGFRRRPLARVNRHHAVMPPERLASLPGPVIHLGDAQALERFGRASFDLVVSQVTFAHIPDKALALEQSARLVAPGGAFVHQLDRRDDCALDFVDDDLPRFVVRDGAARVSTVATLERHGVRVGEADRMVLGEWVRGADELALGLRFDARATANLGALTLCDDGDAIGRWGWRSVYRTAR